MKSINVKEEIPLAEVVLKMATDDQRKIGWTYSYQFLSEIDEECTGWGVGCEGVEAVLFALERRGVITRPPHNTHDAA